MPSASKLIVYFLLSLVCAYSTAEFGRWFEITQRWVEAGKLRWCWMRIGDAALMLQVYAADGHGGSRPDGRLGLGVSICFVCRDALAIYREAKTRGVAVQTPFVGNAMWVTSLTDPDGYRAAAQRAAALGCEGKWAIHPSQIALANDVMSPPEAEVAKAGRILAAMAQARAEGKGAVSLDGRLIDIASIRQAEALVAKAEQIASKRS